jgi:hypothetical protein
MVPETLSQKKKKRGAHMYDLEPSPQKKRPHSLPGQLANSEDDYVDDMPAVEEVEERVPETSQVQPEGEGPDGLGIVDGLQMDVGSVPKKKRGRSRKSGASAISAAGPEPEAPVSTAVEDDSRAADSNIPSSPPLPVKRQRGRPRKSGASSMSALALDAESNLDQVDEATHVEPKPNRKTRPEKETTSTSNGDGSSKLHKKHHEKLHDLSPISDRRLLKYPSDPLDPARRRLRPLRQPWRITQLLLSSIASTILRLRLIRTAR